MQSLQLCGNDTVHSNLRNKSILELSDSHLTFPAVSIIDN